MDPLLSSIQDDTNCRQATNYPKQVQKKGGQIEEFNILKIISSVQNAGSGEIKLDHMALVELTKKILCFIATRHRKKT